ncbi:MAG: hypothetical protein A2513_07220 [Sulfurimonas sp. RIFOXYD12_FULL_33_39]|uniref:diguanylate cyclase domain-containing protein n=1 Tax=unclassified Sulfurimonas TaxID=2623549 RepID=UPI0008AB1BA8|nr:MULTISPECIES: diguanylate cyclase [unclassified Sulfurimonas]OHE09080.1 MAG: hypothetical protein A2513_07220 [Sulfurimonas sp. RIFOXYD12_FULL_33_39]OHE14397.1 MAG: hypothetical protein A2530_10290 [Sulfurimonas sp. RIFOXYD2_FULL_34_21]
MQKIKNENLVFKIISPFVFSLIFIIVSTLGTLYFLQKKHINQQSMEKLENISAVLQKTITSDTKLLQELIEFLQKDDTLIYNYKNQNREWLFLYLHQIYLDFKNNHNITHLYIHNLDKTNFLRAHNRKLHSDKIERFTLNNAVDTGAVSSGIEFGVNHDFALRVVVPWYDDGALIGYIELGKDIEEFSKELTNTLKTNIIFTLDTEVVKQTTKQKSLDDRYITLDNYCVIKSTIVDLKISKNLLEILNKSENISNIIYEENNKIYTISSETLYDMQKQDIGKSYIFIDITNDLRELNSILLQLISMLLIIGIFVLFYFYKYLKKIDKILEDDKKIIELNFQFEQYVNKISSELFVNIDIDKSISNTLKNLGEVLNAHRAYLFIFKKNYSLMDNTHEWCANGVNHEINNLRDEETKPFKWWLRQCKELKPIIIENIYDLPKEARNEKSSLQQQNIKSLMVYQIISKGSLVGFVGIDMVKKSIKWSPTHHSFVKITAEAISKAFDKKADNEKIVDAYDDISLTLNSAFNGILVIDEYGVVSLYNKNFINMWDIDELSINLNTHVDLLNKLSSKILNYKQTLNSVQFLINNNSAELTFITYLNDGRVFEITSQPRVKNSVFRGRVFSFMDITKKIESQKEIELAAKVFENSLEGIIITDSDTNIIKVNKSFLNITGYKIDDILGHKPSILKSNWHDNSFYTNLWNDVHKYNIWEGEIKDRRKNGEVYITLSTIILIKDSQENITNYIGFTRDITKMKEAQNHIEILAYYDSLTNLPNRTLFMDRLEQSLLYCKRNYRKSALLFIDLDNFKNVNDTYGHQVGDLLLQKVSNILLTSVRASDTVSRLSGDEFTVIIRNLESKDDIINIVNNIIEKISKHIIIDETILLDIGSSIGAAIYPDDTTDKDELIKMADEAMYRAKENGKNRLEFYN